MCRPASMIVTRDRVRWLPWCDSHEEIIKKYGFDDRSESPDFVRVKISPVDGRFLDQFDKWVFTADQDYLPDWYHTEESKIAAKKELTAWFAAHVITEGKHEISGDVARNLSVIVMGGEVTITGQTGGDCWARDNAKYYKDGVLQ